MVANIRDALRDLVPFVQIKKREKHPWRSGIFGEASACKFTKSNSPPWVFFTFLEMVPNRAKSLMYLRPLFLKHFFKVFFRTQNSFRRNKSHVHNFLKNIINDTETSDKTSFNIEFSFLVKWTRVCNVMRHLHSVFYTETSQLDFHDKHLQNQISFFQKLIVI